MHYLLLIYGVESRYAQMSPAEMQPLMQAWQRFDREILASGVVEASNRLRPTPSASTVRVRNGKATITDGPFAETKEQLGGFYAIDVPSLDEALVWARRVPSSEYGSVEVRPIWPREEFMT
jgi:hypothetical protein